MIETEVQRLQREIAERQSRLANIVLGDQRKGVGGPTPMERSTGNIKYLREEDCEDNDEGA